MSRFKTNGWLLDRLREPEPLRSLRLQKERLERDQELAALRLLARIEAAALRDEIRRLGGEPCA